MTIQLFQNIRVPEDLPAAADLIVASLSVESRCTNVFGKASLSARTRLAIVEHESPLPSFAESESCLQNLDFAKVNETVLEAALEASIASLEKASLDAIVDISCMSREVMARLFAWFLKLTPSIELNLYVCYSLAEFSAPPTDFPPNEYIAPVASRFAGWPSASQPTSLVVGLGYEPHKAEGAAEFLDASEQWLFVPNSPIREFRDAVEQNNEGLVERARRSNRLVEYQLDDPAGTYGQLELLVSDLSRRSNPVLLPFGPKMFFTLSLLQSYEHAQAGVWAVSGERTAPAVDRRASGCVIGFQAKFQ
ncbi:hypothetical protein B0G81_8839 [Paraburkholderia sp. BL6665CI2N2]|uniref:hypothetical protein n=1 Tax=Paraburkholderia sp. BL6665CI2N2 TaxID=1938806 RepID=UPI0010F11E99|nr:hypothetical protein [Paraburkholderia sp. BL6665CI2N2]TDY15743.1 hypothetical protein B0G81_8839 [Paraburkholderia sp. BL6665CI2N2]